MSVSGVGKSSGGGGSVRKSSSSKSSSSTKKASSATKPSKPAKAAADSVKVNKPEAAGAAKQSNQLINNLGGNFSAKKAGEKTPEQVEREKEIFNQLGDRVTPGKSGRFGEGVTSVDEMTQELFKPEAAAGRDGSDVQNRFNKYMEENHRDPRMDAKISGKDHQFLDMTLSNPAANMRETVTGGFSK
jgi:hypothetical protein